MEETCVPTADSHISPPQMIVTGGGNDVLKVDLGLKLTVFSLDPTFP